MGNVSSDRLRLEPLGTHHAPLLHGPLQAPEIYTYIPEDPPSLDALSRRYAFLENGRSPDGQEFWLNWVAFLSDSMTPIGTFQATLSAEKEKQGSFAYIVFPAFWRQGFAREMADHILPHLFRTYKPSSLAAEIDTRNVASIRLVESLGLVRIATTEAADFFKGESSDEYTYAVTREVWESHR